MKKNINRFLFYSFDFDDNLLLMPTVIHMDKLSEGIWIPIDISSQEFSRIRDNSNYRERNNNIQETYAEFKDFGPRGNKSFLEDAKYAIKNNKYGPSWKKFLKCLKESALFAIVTARGHDYEIIKEVVEYIINNCLSENEQNIMYENCLKFAHMFEDNISYIKENGKFTDNKLIKRYLECCKYYGVGSKSFAKEFNIDSNITIEESKKIALNKFIDICNEYANKYNNKISIGFSDDDKKNVEHIKKYFEYKSSIYKHIKLNVYDTSNVTNIVKTTFESSLENKDGSIMKFTGFNTLPNELGNTTSDFTQPNYSLLQKTKVANKLTKKANKKYKKKFKKIN